MWKERQASTTGYGEVHARGIYFSVIGHYCSLVGLYGKREYLVGCTLYHARFADENWGGTLNVVVLKILYIFVLNYRSREAKLERLNGCL